MWSRLALVLCSLGAAFCSPACEKNITDRDIRGISASEVRRLIDDSKAKNKPELILLIDPRTPAQFQAGHIPGARNIQLDEFQSQSTRQGRLPAYERFETMVVYGNDPASTVARAMAKRLLANDYKEVYWFTGGAAEWVRTGGQLDKAP
jgi:rhodanese-related sulfurtransferase